MGTGSDQDAYAQLVAVLEERAAVFAEVVAQGWRHAGVEGLVLATGIPWTVTTSTRYATSTALSAVLAELRYYRDVTYAEGYVLDDQGDVVPAAWLGRNSEVVFGPRGRAYLGVPLATTWVTRYSKRHGIAVLHSQRAAGYELLANGLPPGARLSDDETSEP